MRKKGFKNEFKYDVFISYSKKDINSVRDIAQNLKNEGLIVWFDEWESNGQSITPTMNRNSLLSSRTLLLVMSESLFSFDWIEKEQESLIFRDPTDLQRKFVPLLIESCDIDNIIKQYAFIDYKRKSKSQFLKLLNACQQKSLSKIPAPKKISELKSIKLYKGHTELIRRVAINSSGSIGVSSSNDKTIRVWDLDQEKCLSVLTGHNGVIWSATLSSNGKILVSGSHDGTIRLWNTQTGQCDKVFEAKTTQILDGSITSDGKIAATLHDNGLINIWDLEKNSKIITITTKPAITKTIVISNDGKTIYSGTQDCLIHIWSVSNGNCLGTLIGHTGSVFDLSLTKDGSTLVSGSSDCTIRIWNLSRERCMATLEGHTGHVWSVAISENGQRIVSGSGDKSVRVWDTESGICLNILTGHYDSVYSVAISTDCLRIISASRDMTVRQWNLFQNEDIAKKSIDGRLRYTNAKVLLVGDTGVGKSGLAIRLAENRFESTISSDAIWATQLKLPSIPNNSNIEREIWLWDFAGQPDYRLVHQLFMDETSLAVLVFNPQQGNPLEGVSQWTVELQRAARRPFNKLLVAGRCDRGGLIESRKNIDTFIANNGFSGYFETSANTGSGCKELYDAIINGIEWNLIPWTSSPLIFQQLKREIVKLKDEGKVLLRFSELKQQLEMRLVDAFFTIDELIAVIGLLAGPGIVWQLEFGDFILLQPEKINSYAAALIRKVRSHVEEIGIISEEDALSGRIDFQDLKRLSQTDEHIVLRAMHQSFINHGICLREQTEAGTMLVFPSYFKRERPSLLNHPSIFVTYTLNGNLEDIYSTLIVRLHHTSAFQKDSLWKFAADFKTQGGKKIGIKLTKLNPGSGEISIYFEPKISDDIKVTFIRYVHEHLKVKTIDFVRLRHYVCPFCDTPVENRNVAFERLKSGKKDIVCVKCEERVPLWDLIEEKFASEQMAEEVSRLDENVRISLDNESKELILIGHAFAIAGEAGQIFRPTANSDWGIDGEIEFKNSKGEASGIRIYLQLKSGDSYTYTRKSDGKEIFRVKNKRHVEYWKAQAYPVMLVIRNSDNQIRWMDVTQYLKKARTKQQIVFKGEPFTALNLTKMKETLLIN